MSLPSSSKEAPRYHGLDALRAAMMFLGLVLHGAASYMTEATDAWGFKDPSTSELFDLTVFAIHIFRMPVFFVLAGFFGALLCEKRGPRELLANRFSRIGWPLLLGWPVLYPATVFGFDFAAARSGTSASGSALGHPPDGQIQMDWVLIHLWFLYYLLIFYTAAALVLAVAARLPAHLQARGSAAFRGCLASRARVLLFALPTALSLLSMHLGMLETIPSLTPAPRILLAYGVFFGFGWLLFRQRELLPTLEAGATRRLWSSLGLLPFMLWSVGVLSHRFPGDERIAQGVAAVCGAAATWLVIFGLIGVFQQRFRQPSPALRYLADASYWVYLVHLPVVIWTTGLLAPVGLHAVPKFLIAVALTLLLSLLSYDLLVRSTRLGVFLNGRRYPRWKAAVQAEKIALVDGA